MKKTLSSAKSAHKKTMLRNCVFHVKKKVHEKIKFYSLQNVTIGFF